MDLHVITFYPTRMVKCCVWISLILQVPKSFIESLVDHLEPLPLDFHANLTPHRGIVAVPMMFVFMFLFGLQIDQSSVRHPRMCAIGWRTPRNCPGHPGTGISFGLGHLGPPVGSSRSMALQTCQVVGTHASAFLECIWTSSTGAPGPRLKRRI
jgi:hypothetical protein